MLDSPVVFWLLVVVAVAETAAVIIVPAVRIARDLGWLWPGQRRPLFGSISRRAGWRDGLWQSAIEM